MMTSFSVHFCSTLIPRHPRSGIRQEFGGTALHLTEVVERIGRAQLAGVDQAHEQVAHFGAVQRAIEQSVLAMQHGTLEGALAEIMPTAGLCRVDGLLNRPTRLLMIADAA